MLDPSKIHIAGMRIVNGEVKSPYDFMTQEIKDFTSSCRFQMSFNLEDQLVKADLEVLVETVSQGAPNTEEAKAHFHLVFFYTIDNLNELAVPQPNGTIDLKAGLGNALVSITYSTTRGILMTRFQGTALSDFVLPVIDPNNLLK